MTRHATAINKYLEKKKKKNADSEIGPEQKSNPDEEPDEDLGVCVKAIQQCHSPKQSYFDIAPIFHNISI